MLQVCFTVKLQKCFVGYNIPPEVSSDSWWIVPLSYRRKHATDEPKIELYTIMCKYSYHKYHPNNLHNFHRSLDSSGSADGDRLKKFLGLNVLGTLYQKVSTTMVALLASFIIRGRVIKTERIFIGWLMCGQSPCCRVLLMRYRARAGIDFDFMGALNICWFFWELDLNTLLKRTRGGYRTLNVVYYCFL